MPDLKELRDHARELTDVTGVVVEIIERGDRVYVLMKKVRLPVCVYRLTESDVLFITRLPIPAVRPGYVLDGTGCRPHRWLGAAKC